MLTGKCKDAFEIWYLTEIRKREDIQERYFDEALLQYFYNSGGEILTNAFYVAFFDSVGIPIEINIGYYDGYFYEYSLILADTIKGEKPFETRTEATISAIKKADEIYNNKLGNFVQK